MNYSHLFIAIAFFYCLSIQPAKAQRQRLDFNRGWSFHFGYDTRQQPALTYISLPHTWNSQDAPSKQIGYLRQSGIYEKYFKYTSLWREKRLFLYFAGANTVATVFLNGHWLTQHKGGYTAFCVEITRWLNVGENHLEVDVSNAWRPDVLPLSGDFNCYGGLHRPVTLIVTGQNCITPLDFASPGVYITPEAIGPGQTKLSVRVKLSLKKLQGLTMRIIVTDRCGRQVATNKSAVYRCTGLERHLRIFKPHFWNGVADPYEYHLSVQLLKNSIPIDEVKQDFGIRKFTVSSNTGFWLNDQHIDLHGVGFHEDTKGKGSSMDTDDLHNDMTLLEELGVNAVRLTHYPHAQYCYDWCDRKGVVVWSEIPLVGPGGYSGSGYNASPALRQQARQVLTEMIRQNYNHPAICFWGLFNELKTDGDDPVCFIKQLDQLAKKEDPSRLTTCASFLDDDHFNHVTDLIAWNKYYGWYDSDLNKIGAWADRIHRLYPNKPIAVSEFGAGGSVRQHTQQLSRPSPEGSFHPEEWQTAFHEANWAMLAKRPFIWAKFVWALKDFGSAIRTEGDTAGINDKGLVTYDGQTKKDAFFFYKSNWNNAPMVYIADRRNKQRTDPITTIKVYSNLKEVALRINGRIIGKTMPDSLHRACWNFVILQKGLNLIQASGWLDQKEYTDSCTWTLINTNR